MQCMPLQLVVLKKKMHSLLLSEEDLYMQEALSHFLCNASCLHLAALPESLAYCLPDFCISRALQGISSYLVCVLYSLRSGLC